MILDPIIVGFNDVTDTGRTKDSLASGNAITEVMSLFISTPSKEQKEALFVSTLISDRLVHPVNTDEFIEETDAGIKIEVRPLQHSNA